MKFADLASLQERSLTDQEAADLALELFVVGYEGTDLAPLVEDQLARGLAGVILFRRNLTFTSDGAVDLEALAAHTRTIHTAAGRSPLGLPAVCSVDQEGGLVARLRAPFTSIPPMRVLGDHGDEDLIHRVGRQLGRECRAAGFNVDFAPVLDVDTNPANPIIGNRSFSRDPHLVARFAKVLLQGMEAEGVLGCGKHFPGHGDTDADSHLALPVLPHGLDRLRAVELVPFRELSPHLSLVMTAHVLFPALDPSRPATVSPDILRPLLRGECGYDGVIVSDDLEMAGIAKVLQPRAIVLAGLLAGVDLFLVCRRDDMRAEAIEAAGEVLRRPPDDPLRQTALQAIGRVRKMRSRLTAPFAYADDIRQLLASFETCDLRRVLGAGTLETTEPKRTTT
ncbi:MAG: beta-N-acetylhexosaminidase [Myxococcota bacterium]